MTGSTCLLFCVEDETTDVSPGTRRLVRAEVYDIARTLTVSIDALPTAVFFTAPDTHYKLTVRLDTFLSNAVRTDRSPYPRIPPIRRSHGSVQKARGPIGSTVRPPLGA